MKRLIIIFFLAICNQISFAQIDIEPQNIKIQYGNLSIQGVEELDSATMETIHDAVIKWIATLYKEPKSVIKSDIPSMVVIEGFGPKQTDDGGYKIRLTFDIKDGKYRWTMSDIKYHSNILAKYTASGERSIEATPWFTNSSESDREKRIIEEFSPYVFSFRNNIKNNISNDDW